MHALRIVAKRKLHTKHCTNCSRAHVCRAVNCANFNLDTCTLEWESMAATSKWKRLCGLSMWAFVYKQLRKLKIGHQTRIYNIYAIKYRFAYIVVVIVVVVVHVYNRWNIDYRSNDTWSLLRAVETWMPATVRWMAFLYEIIVRWKTSWSKSKGIRRRRRRRKYL